jgi:hypothetical protein
MTAPGSIRQADINRIAKIAREQGVVVEIERDGFKIRVRPDHPEEQPVARKPDIRL